MAGDEEARARAVLMEMQSRIAQGPQFALGLGAEVSPELVRGAFLQLTKQFHPARFGRMSTEIQRLSNEVFLGIKSAHDLLQRMLGGSVRPSRSEGSGAVHAIPAEGSARNTAPTSPRSTASIPRLGSPSTPTGPTTQQLGRAPSPPLRASTPGARAPTPALGVSMRPGTPPSTGQTTQPLARPQTPGARAPTPALGVSMRPGTPPSTGQTTQPLARPQTPASTGSIPRATTPGTTGAVPRAQTPGAPLRPQTPGSSGALPIQRPGTPPLRPGTPPQRSSSPSQPPARESSTKIPTVQTQQLPKASPAFDERLALREALMSLNEKNWSAAKITLNTLAVKVPHSKQYRSLLCYARGREAHAAGRADEAMLEYQRALELDPQLELANQAMAELTRRR